MGFRPVLVFAVAIAIAALQLIQSNGCRRLHLNTCSTCNPPDPRVRGDRFSLYLRRFRESLEEKRLELQDTSRNFVDGLLSVYRSLTEVAKNLTVASFTHVEFPWFCRNNSCHRRDLLNVPLCQLWKAIKARGQTSIRNVCHRGNVAVPDGIDNRANAIFYIYITYRRALQVTDAVSQHISRLLREEVSNP